MKMRAIVLAAGKGTRMKSATPKVLHELCGRPMLWFVLRALREAGIGDAVVVTNAELQERIGDFGVRGVLQPRQLGTGDAVRIALAELKPQTGGVIVVCADMPLITAEILRGIAGSLDSGTNEKTALALVTVNMPLPSNFGRIVRRGADVERIVEVRDATPSELAIDEMNAGIYAFDERDLREAIVRLRNHNAQGEYYLTDTIEDLVRSGKRVRPVVCGDHLHVLGINDRGELARARREMNQRLCSQHMRDGVTIVDPGSTYLEPELKIGHDTVIYPNSSIGRLSKVGEACVIGPGARLSHATLGDRVTIRESVVLDSQIGNGSSVGPFAHLRNNTVLAEDVRIGNFVEVKNSELAAGVKVSHLSYIGDASIGEEANIGAGTITCNFDGKKKHRTKIGKNAMIGSNSSLIAPVEIGEGALTGAGSVVTKDVPPGERVVGNPAQPIKRKKK